MMFVNAQTLSTLKLAYMLVLLQQFCIICITEVNNQQQIFNDVPTDRCQVFFDPLTPRLGMICNHSVKIEYKGIGVQLQDPGRIQNDKTVIQSNLYRVTLENNLILEFENTYMVPDITSPDLELARQHYEKQSLKQFSYIAGGDFNINWKQPSKKSKFSITTLQQNVSGLTRIATYTRNNQTRTSKSLIDLIFTNITASPKIKQCTVFKTPNDSNSGLTFDHHAVTI